MKKLLRQMLSVSLGFGLVSSALANLTAEMKEAGDVGVRGTPSFFINGKQPAGRSFELYKSIIDEEIKAKKKA